MRIKNGSAIFQTSMVRPYNHSWKNVGSYLESDTSVIATQFVNRVDSRKAYTYYLDDFKFLTDDQQG